MPFKTAYLLLVEKMIDEFQNMMSADLEHCCNPLKPTVAIWVQL